MPDPIADDPTVEPVVVTDHAAAAPGRVAYDPQAVADLMRVNERMASQLESYARELREDFLPVAAAEVEWVVRRLRDSVERVKGTAPPADRQSPRPGESTT